MKTLAIGILGAATLVGREMVAVLQEREFPVSSLRLVDTDLGAGQEVEFEGVDVLVQSIDEGLAGVDLAFFASDMETLAEHAEAVAASGGVVIDCSGHFAASPDVPLIVPECNASSLEEFQIGRIIASPDPISVATSTILMPLHAEAIVRRAVITALEPVSRLGAAGIDELSRQTVDLLNGRSVDAAVFPARISFNVMPAPDQVDFEPQLIDQLRRILGETRIELSVSRFLVPTFYGTGISMNIELERPLDAAEARDLLRQSPGILTLGNGSAMAPLSVADAVGQGATLLGDVRPDPSMPNGLSLWAAVDGSRKGTAVNAVQIAEILLRDFL